MIDLSSVPASGDHIRSVVRTASVGIDPMTAWRAWTTSEALTAWWPVPETAIDLRLGGAFELLFDPTQPEGLQGSEGCRVLSYVPGEMLSFTWNAPPHLPLRAANTWVVLTFASDDAGTSVRLVHTGFLEGPDWDDYRSYFASAWTRVLELFTTHFGAPRPDRD